MHKYLKLGAESGFKRALETYTPPWQDTLTTDLIGSGSQRMWMLARLAQRYNLQVSGVLDPEPFHRVGIPVFTEAVPEGWYQSYTPFNSSTILNTSDWRY